MNQNTVHIQLVFDEVMIKVLCLTQQREDLVSWIGRLAIAACSTYNGHLEIIIKLVMIFQGG